jgi:single-stranded-DNA-specific exonuclease
MQKEWRVLPEAPQDFIKDFPRHHPIITQLLYNRGLQSQQDMDIFFNPDFERLHDPFLFQDMRKAVDRLWQALDNKEKIMIHGDYDCDGVTSSTTMFRPLKILGADVDVFIPHREKDGYGINLKTVDKFIEQKVQLVITVDCGVTNVEPIKKLKEAGIDVIVTDHHEPLEELPDACAILNPKVKSDKYPFLGLSGAAVSYKFVQAIYSEEEKIKKYEAQLLEWGGTKGFLKWMLDVVAIGVVADVMPLVDENRILVKWGLLVLEKTRNVGLKHLLDLIRTQRIDTYTIGFQIAPRINAAGRMDHARIAFDLLVEEDEVEAEKLAWKLQQHNQDRQSITEVAVSQARNQMDEQKGKSILFAYHADWPAGIIGLIAGRLSEAFYKPVIVMTQTESGVVGSGRSVEGYDLTKGLVSVSKVFSRFGGHSQACGFTLTDLKVMDEFRSGMCTHADKEMANKNLTPFFQIDAEIRAEDVGLGFLNQLEAFEPFGEVNSKPNFLLKNLEVAGIDFLGQEKNHLRLMVKHTTPRVFKMMKFNSKSLSEVLRMGQKLDLVVELSKNEWKGRVEPQFIIVDIKIKK